MPEIFLSVDLDFWNKIANPYHTAGTGLAFLEKCCQIKVPISLHMEHQDILNHANRYECDRLINVDYHDDLISFKNKDDLHKYMKRGAEDYNWVNFIYWRNKAHYTWIHPMKNINYGICDPRADLYNGKIHRHGWQSVSHQRKATSKALFNAIAWDDVVGVGIVVSPSYITNERLAERASLYLKAARPFLNLRIEKDFDMALECLEGI